MAVREARLTGPQRRATGDSAADLSEAVESRRAGRWARVWSGVLAAWGVLTGLAPHVLHHVGPLAGAALLAGAGGALLFGALGLVAAIPFLLRLHRRFATWKAPALALAVFVAMFSLSSFVIGPALRGGEGNGGPTIEQPGGGHASHHR